MNSSINSTTHVFRVDKFAVPSAAREEFLDQVEKTHKVLRKQDGFVKDNLLELTSGSSDFNFVTIAEWQGQKYVEAAKSTVKTMHKEQGFKPKKMFQRLGIKADIGNYTETVS